MSNLSSDFVASDLPASLLSLPVHFPAWSPRQRKRTTSVGSERPSVSRSPYLQPEGQGVRGSVSLSLAGVVVLLLPFGQRSDYLGYRRFLRVQWTLLLYVWIHLPPGDNQGVNHNNTQHKVSALSK